MVDVNTIRVLHVDDEPSFGDLVAEFLEREDERIEVITETSAADGLTRLESGRDRIDCIVSDYDMPKMDGLGFLEAIRDEDSELPFVLYTGKGSEEVASDAISMGASDYLQKGGGTEQYELLANRVRNAVEKYQSTQERYRVYQALETATQGIGLIDDDGEYIYLNEAYSDLYGYDTEDLIGENWSRLYPDDEVARFEEDIFPTLEKEGNWDGRTQGLCRDGSLIPEQVSLTQLDSGGHVCVVQDISNRIERNQELELRNRAIDEAPVGVTITDPNREDNPIIYANEEFVRISAYSREEIIGENHRIFHGSETREAPVERMREAVDAHEPVTVELRNYRANGEMFWNRVSIAPVHDEDGNVTNHIRFQDDITERIEREQELRRNKRRFEAMFADPNILVGLLKPDGTVLDINDTAMEYVDAHLDDMTGKPFSTTPWCPEEMQSVIQETVEQAADGEYVEYEADLGKPDGTPYSITGVLRPVTNDCGKVISLILSARDVTERKQREEKLERTRDRMEFALEGTNAVIWEHNPDTGNIRTHPDPCPVLGNTVETYEDLIHIAHPDYRDVVSDAVETSIRTGEPQQVEYRTDESVDADWLVARIEPVTADGGSVEQLIGLMEDITERKQREQILERQNERFDELASAVAHDLQTPLSTARGRVELAIETGDTEQMNKALTALERTDQLREDFVNVLRTRDIVGETESVDVDAVAEEVWKSITPSDDASLRIEDPTAIDGNPDAIRRLLENLFSNSIEHGSEDVTVRLGRIGDGFFVEDDGPGIPENERDEIFTPGYSTKDGGSGVGMVSVREIASAHEWRVSVTESESDGARFEFRGIESS